MLPERGSGDVQILFMKRLLTVLEVSMSKTWFMIHGKNTQIEQQIRDIKMDIPFAVILNPHL